MAADVDPKPILIVKSGRTARDLDNPDIAIIQLAADEENGPYLDFVADAPTLEKLARMLKQAATDIRGRAN